MRRYVAPALQYAPGAVLRTRRWGRAGRLAMVWMVVPLVITLAAWQPVPLPPIGGLDPSWLAGLEMAHHAGLTFGTQVVWTYGPLGFLDDTTLWFNHLAIASIAYTITIRFGLAAAIFVCSRRTFGNVVAFLLAIIVASVDAALQEPVIALCCGVWMVTRSAENERRSLWLSGALGALSAIEVLNKQSIGVSLVALTAVTILCLPGSRGKPAAAALGAGIATFLVCWLALGQALGAVPHYLGHAIQISSGYAGAMSLGAGGLGWAYTAAAVAIAVGVWAALTMTETGTTRARSGVVALWIVFCFFAFKEGFVRADPIHLEAFFAALLAGFFAFSWQPRRRPAALIAAAGLFVFALAAESLPFNDVVDPTGKARIAVRQIRTVLSSSRRHALIEAGRAGIEAAEPLDGTSLALVRTRTVSVFPSELALVWAYHLRWDPVPVLQSYAAYTSSLDQIDADFVRSARAPERLILQPNTAIDGRVPWFDEPSTSRAILCRYRVLHRTSAVAVLGRGPDRCSSERLQSRVRAAWGQRVSVPAPPDSHSLVFVKVSGVQPSGLERVVALLYKPATRGVILNGAPHRLVGGTAGDGLPLRMAPGLDYPAPFNVAFGAQTIAVTKGSGAQSGGSQLTFTFYSVSLSG